MLTSHKSLFAAFVFLALFFCAFELQQSFANPYGYSEEHAAWGGNGGWWGGGNHDLYDDYAWRTEDTCCAHCHARKNYHYSCNHCNYCHTRTGRYRYHTCEAPPINEYEYHNSVPGAGLYIDLEGKR